MKTRFFTLLISIFACLGLCSSQASAASIEDGVYYITCSSMNDEGYLGLGAYHDVDPYIYYVSGGQNITKDGYWVITNTGSGYTFRNQESGQLLVYTTDRVDLYYKNMTLADESLGDYSEYWNLIENYDGTFSVQSVANTAHYWNLRSGTGLLGTYTSSAGSSNNEHFTFHLKGDDPGIDPGDDPGDDPTPQPAVTHLTFPSALHVYLTDGRIEAYPLEYVTKYSVQGGKLVIETNLGQNYSYNMSEVATYSEQAPTDFPTFESFKFNNKFNDQLFTDAEGEFVGDTVYVTIAAIGKRLTPSFKLADGENIVVYVDNVLQTSKETRLRFDKDIYYVVTRPGITMLLPQSDMKGSYSMQPYGRVVRVHVDWLTDRAEVPTIYINTADGQSITSKTEYKDATIVIDGHGIFPSMDETPMQIRGRGNSSWGWSKKPYRLKFEEKVKPLGMTKGKSWVLLANGIGGSMLTNAVGMKAANQMGAAGANHIVPVDIYLNGEYRGSYNFTEKVGFSNNSIDIDDETVAAMLELDSYYDEPEGQKFRTEPYGLPINIKEPEFDEGTTTLTLEQIEADFNKFMSTLYRGGDISKYVDIEQLVRFMMVDELTLNYEFYHPKSTFCYKESYESDTCKYIFGPVWDLDWGFGYEQSRSYFRDRATDNYWIDNPNMEVVQFIRDLRYKYEPMNEVYKTLWKKFLDNDLQELMEYCQDYYDFAKNSFDANRTKWGDHTDYKQQAVQAAEWLQARTQQVYDDIINNVRPDISPVEPVDFANDKLYTLRCRRGSLVLNAAHTGLDVGQVRTDAPEEDGQFAIINIAGQNYLYSPVTKQYLNYRNNGTWVSELGTPITFDNSKADGEYQYMMSVTNDWGQTLYFNNSSTRLVINSWNTADDGNRWLIEEVDDFDPTEALDLARGSLIAVTNRYLFEGKVVGEETIEVPYGAVPPEPSSQWSSSLVELTEPDDMPYEITDDVTLDYTVEWTGPFQFSKSVDKAHWYNMTIRGDYFVSKQSEEPYYPGEVADDDLFLTPEFQWAFGGDPYHLVVYNRSTGFDESLTPEGEYGVMRPGQYAWDLLPNMDGFVLHMAGSAYSCLNQFGGVGGPLKFWHDGNSPYDNGSTFRVYDAPDELITIMADNLTMTYGDTVPQLTYTYSGGELIGTPKLTTTATQRSAVGVYPIKVEAGGVQNGRLEFVDGTLTITQAPLSVSVRDVAITEGEAIPDFQLLYSGWRNGDTEASAFSEKPKATTTATASSQPGTYPITVSSGKAQNYSLSYTAGTLTILKRDIFLATYKVLFDDEVVATATAQVPSGDALPAPPAELSNKFISLQPYGQLPQTVTENVTVYYTAVWSGPFQFSTKVEDALWYNMTIRNDYYVGYQDEEPYYPSKVSTEALADRAYHWAFGGNPYKVLVYNRLSNFDKTLTRDGENAVMRAGKYAWDLLPNDEGFVLRVPGTASTCINQFGGNEGPLQFWDSKNSLTDDGSTFHVFEATADGIVEMANDQWQKANAAVYDLSGRKVRNSVPSGSSPSSVLKKGIYIINGRRVLIK
ncbi:MAG: CotH kinase family protein [Bacteroidaceae bacterium]|nr:CotH kinase family protein [Bacteroidaceae bacterium]